MVRGLEKFRDHFHKFTDQYALIGGMACFLAMDEAGFDFRTTKDFDIVLWVEALDKDFVEVFWEFVQAGGYRQKEKSSGERQYYRFQQPEVEGFPLMLELFSREPDALSLAGGSHLTPIPTDDELSSLSAILLSADYYFFIQNGTREQEGISFIGPEHLIPLKAKAWLDLSERKNQGESVDGRSVRKHKNDIFRLYQILNPEFVGEVPDKVKMDLREFLANVENEPTDLNSLGLAGHDSKTIFADIFWIYGLG